MIRYVEHSTKESEAGGRNADGDWLMMSTEDRYCTVSLRPHGPEHTQLPYPSPFPAACSDSCPLSWWCHPTISSLSSPSPAFYLSQHQGLFQWTSSSNQVVQVLELQLQHRSFQWIFRVDFLYNWLVWYPCHSRDFEENFLAPQFGSMDSSVLSILYGPTLTSIYDYWKSHSFNYTDLCRQSSVSAF